MTANIPQPVPPAGPGPLRQFEIYLQGAMAGAKPIVPIAFAELEAKAREKLTPEAYAYIACGAGFEHTVEENTAAFDRWRIVPRMLRDVASLRSLDRAVRPQTQHAAPRRADRRAGARAQGRRSRDRQSRRRGARVDDLFQPGVCGDGDDGERDGR